LLATIILVPLVEMTTPTISSIAEAFVDNFGGFVLGYMLVVFFLSYSLIFVTTAIVQIFLKKLNRQTNFLILIIGNIFFVYFVIQFVLPLFYQARLYIDVPRDTISYVIPKLHDESVGPVSESIQMILPTESQEIFYVFTEQYGQIFFYKKEGANWSKIEMPSFSNNLVLRQVFMDKNHIIYINDESSNTLFKLTGHSWKVVAGDIYQLNGTTDDGIINMRKDGTNLSFIEKKQEFGVDSYLFSYLDDEGVFRKILLYSEKSKKGGSKHFWTKEIDGQIFVVFLSMEDPDKTVNIFKINPKNLEKKLVYSFNTTIYSNTGFNPIHVYFIEEKNKLCFIFKGYDKQGKNTMSCLNEKNKSIDKISDLSFGQICTFDSVRANLKHLGGGFFKCKSSDGFSRKMRVMEYKNGEIKTVDAVNNFINTLLKKGGQPYNQPLVYVDKNKTYWIGHDGRKLTLIKSVDEAMVAE
jgi:hypothetical protein